MCSWIAAGLLPIAACGNAGGGTDVPGTGSGSQRTFAASGFTSVELRGPDDVDVRVGLAFAVRAEGDPRALDKLRIETVDGTLRVGRQRGVGMSRDNGARIHVTMPRIAGASLAGSGDLSVDRAAAETFTAKLAGSGTLGIAALQARAADLSLAGSGGMKLAGRAERLSVSIAGSGDIEAAGLSATSAEVRIMGSGSVRTAVNGAAEVAIMGSGDADLGPRARCRTRAMGSGRARCGG